MEFAVVVSIFGAAYLLGSIPFGLLLTHIFGAGDIRKIGSGNIGATNVMRTGRKGLAIATLLLDLGKGAAAVLLTKEFFGGNLATVAGLVAILGHIFPIWLSFRGGKGVATALGVYFALNFGFGLFVVAVWLLMFWVIRISSLAAIVSFCVAPVMAFLQEEYSLSAFALLLAFIIVFTHRQNISRLLSGAELGFNGGSSGHGL